jgi:hypothetical protein
MILISETFNSAGGHNGRGNAIAFARSFKSHVKGRFPVYLLKEYGRESWIIVRDFDEANGDGLLDPKWVREIEHNDPNLSVM